MSHDVVNPERFSDGVLDRARKAWESGKVEADPKYEMLWWVQGGADLPYRVQLLQRDGFIEWITCTCPHGLNTGPSETRCYHVAAVLMKIESGE